MSRSLSAPPSMRVERRSDAVSLAQVWRALVRNRRWILGLGLLAFIVSTAFVNLVTPRYSAEARLLLESRDSFYTRPTQDRQDLQPLIDESAVASQVQVVLSRDLAREAIKRLGLVGNAEFDPQVDGPGPLAQLATLLGLEPKEQLERPPEDRIFEKFFDRLLVYPVGKSRIVAVEFRSRDRDLAAKAANTVAELYLEFQEAAKKDTARSASNWLGPNIDTLRERVTQAEAKVEAFRAGNSLLTGSNNITITAQQMTDLNTQLAQARTARADAEAKARLIRDLIKSGRTFEIPDVANNELVRRLVEQRVTLRAQQALEARTLLSAHPRMKELDAQLADLEAQIRGATERTVRTLENDAKIAGSRVETLQAAIDEQKKVVAAGNENEVQLRALEREAKAQRDQLESYLGRYREATARDVQDATPPDARIVSRAIVPAEPSFPKKVPVVALATLATLAAVSAAIAARELFGTGAPSTAPAPAWALIEHHGASERRDYSAENLSGVIARSVPGSGSGMGRDGGHGAGGEADRYDFKALVTRLARSSPQDRGRRVLVTGVERTEDAVAMATGLGRRLADEGRAILVAVDAMGRSRAHPGFTDLVAGESTFVDIIEREPASRLHVVSAGTLDGALLNEEWEGVDIALQAFDQTYDWVLCVLHDSSDQRLLGLLAPRVDAVVIASNAEPTHGPLVALYDAAKAAGASDVVVARETGDAEALRASA